ncbi:MAG: C10 family peptidase, partial [Bacteroidales bacterium]|nr:C10 family peptidase [Bacteroidales bacterium]
MCIRDSVYAGCVATMMGMIMYYYRYPTQPTGFHSYQSPYGTLSINFNQHQYKYEEMPYKLQGENLMVAKLLFHCGVSVNMNYSPHGSGAYMDDVVEAMKTYFGYHSSIYLDYKDYYSDNGWINKLKTELNAFRPIPYAGFDTTSGHAFVCDGYDEMNLFHFNWGWSGYFNGYYAINNLNPASNFSLGQQAIFNCYPASQYNTGSCAHYSMQEKSGSLQVGFPFSNYGNNLQCSWLIDPNDTLTGIDLYPAYFATESANDILTIYKGSDANAPLFATYSGNSMPSHIFIPTQKLYVTFTSNSSVTDKGFHIDYYCSSPLFCTTNNILTQESGYISDGSGSYPYRENTRCRWILKPIGADGIFLHFINFNLDYPSDILSVYKYPENILLETFSGYMQNQIFYFPYPQLNLIFKTNDAVNKDGFLIYYSASFAGMNEKEPWSIRYWFSDHQTIEVFLKNLPSGPYQLYICDVTGRTTGNFFLHINSPESHYSFPSNLKPGVYFMRLENENFRWDTKIMIAR